METRDSSAASEAGPQPERYIALSKVKEICERIMKASNDLVNDSAEYRIGQWSGAEKAMWEIDCAALAGGKDATQAVQSGPDVAGATPAVAEEAPSEAVGDLATWQTFLEWNRSLNTPLVNIGSEYAVAQVAIRLHNERRRLYVAWRTIEDAPYSIPILCVWDNGTQMVAFQDVMEGWQDAETRDPLETKPTHWMHLPTAPEAK